MAVDNTIHCDFNLEKKGERKEGILFFENSEKHEKEREIWINIYENILISFSLIIFNKIFKI